MQRINSLLSARLVLLAIYLTATFSFAQAEAYKPMVVPARTFLLHQTTIKSTKDIGAVAKEHIPLLQAEAVKRNLTIKAPIHHFYRMDSKWHMAIGYPVSKPEKAVQGQWTYKLVEKPISSCLSSVHQGSVAKVGESWRKMHEYVTSKGELISESCEIYLTDLKNLKSDSTRIELQEHLIDKSTLKGECVVTGFAKNSQAKKAGLKASDIITGYANFSIANSADLLNALKAVKTATDKTKLSFTRDGKPMSILVNIGPLGAGVENR